jgi:hypothetical protein
MCWEGYGFSPTIETQMHEHSGFVEGYGLSRTVKVPKGIGL